MTAPHFDPGENQNGAEKIDHEMKSLEQRDAGEDHGRAQDERAENPPKKDAMPIARWDSEVTEKEREDEDIVHAERNLDEVSGEKLQRRLLPRLYSGVRTDPAEINAEIEKEREARPDAGPRQRLRQSYRVRLAMKDAQVQRKHRENERGKRNPPERLRCHGAKASDARMIVRAKAKPNAALAFAGSGFTKIIRVRSPRAWEK